MYITYGTHGYPDHFSSRLREEPSYGCASHPDRSRLRERSVTKGRAVADAHFMLGKTTEMSLPFRWTPQARPCHAAAFATLEGLRADSECRPETAFSPHNPFRECRLLRRCKMLDLSGISLTIRRTMQCSSADDTDGSLPCSYDSIHACQLNLSFGGSVVR